MQLLSSAHCQGKLVNIVVVFLGGGTAYKFCLFAGNTCLLIVREQMVELGLSSGIESAFELDDLGSNSVHFI